MTPRVHVEGPLGEGMALELPPAAGHHARVLRLREGDELTVFDGSGGEWKALVIGEAKVRLQQFRKIERESPLAITLVQGVSSGERMDYTVQKAVELGVTAIHPLAASRSVVRLDAERERKRVAHWQAVAIAACEQCGRNRIPAVAAPATLADWLAPKQGRDAGALRVLLSPRGAARLRELPRPAGTVELLAGPEGGFTPEEEALARGSGFTPVLLGPRVLRTETAAVAALAAMQALWGDF
jgi:16S rRNA (uracil1498-N3)-methyltransferase